MKQKSKLLWSLVSVLMVVSLAIPTWSTTVVASPATEIWNWYDLDAVRNNLGGSYVLMTDLDSTTAGYAELAGPYANEGSGWVKIGSMDNRFSGTFDGQGYEVRDFFVNRPDENYVGLFGATGASGVIENVGIVDMTVVGKYYVGGLVGLNYAGLMSNCYARGEVGGYYGVGGLVGWHLWATVSGSHSNASVTGGASVGGLVGYNSGTVSNSYATGSVTGGQYVGGLVGFNSDTVNDSYARGTVTRSYGEGTEFGGFVGTNDRGKLVNCYSTGSVHYADAEDPTDKGFAGRVHTDGDYEMTGNFWDIETSGQTSTAGHATGKTTAVMKNIATFLAADWDIEFTVEADPTDGYPFLAWQLGSSPVWYMSAIPTVTTQPATDVTTDSATLNMGFTVGDYSPVEIRLSWREFGAPAWEVTDWVTKTESGTHDETLSGLNPGTQYEFKAQLNYDSTVVDGATLVFSTSKTLWDHVGIWRSADRIFALNMDGTGTWNPATDVVLGPFGLSTDVPVVGDWTGDGFDQIGIWRTEGTWKYHFALDMDYSGTWTEGDVLLGPFGQEGDVPIIGDWNGDGTDQVGVWRPGERSFYLDMDGEGVFDDAVKLGPFGLSTDVPIVGDWDGSGIDQVGIWRASARIFALDMDYTGTWNSETDVVLGPFGLTTDVPIIGDWDGNGIDQVGIWRASARIFALNMDYTGTWNSATDVVLGPFGLTTDVPVIGRWKP